MPDEGDPQVIWISGQSWDRYAGTHRNMAAAMAKYARILWVDPPVSPATTANHRHGAVRTIRPVLARATERITRLTPVALPGLSRAGVRVTTPVFVRAQVKWAARRLNLRPSAVIMAYLGDLLGGWGEGAINVLYGTDDYVAGAGLMGLPVHHLRKRERRALTRADIVVAVTPQLAERWTGFGARPVVIPNGCWPAGGASESREQVGGLSRPVVGLVGQLSERIDFDVLEAIVDAGFSLLVVGPRDPRWEPERFSQLIGRPSVRYVGAVPTAEVPGYLAAVDVGITPYRDTAFNRASFPLKTLDYLGAGVPAVSADLPAARWLRADLVTDVSEDVADQILVLANSGQDYVTAIREMATRGHGVAQRCITFAERHSWASRAEHLAAEIGLLPARRLRPAGTDLYGNPLTKGNADRDTTC
jgi:teichuronic acid biosynthesis glycosyltransferase TuaH